MSEQRKKILIDLISGLILAAGVFALRWSAEYSVIHKLCDAFFVAGVLLTGFGGLKAARNAGMFDMMTFGVSSVLRVSFPWIDGNSPLEKRGEDFVTYKERKREERKPASDLLISGAIYLVVSGILLVIYCFTG